MTTEEKILIKLCELVSNAERETRHRKRMDFMPPHPNERIREFQAQQLERADGHRSALVAAIAETDLEVEAVARLASGYEYELAAGFLRRSVSWVERERQQRHIRERIAAERGQEFCQNCGNPCDGSYCDLNCLEQHNAEAIAASDLSTEAWILKNLR